MKNTIFSWHGGITLLMKKLILSLTLLCCISATFLFQLKADSFLDSLFSPDELAKFSQEMEKMFSEETQQKAPQRAAPVQPVQQPLPSSEALEKKLSVQDPKTLFLNDFVGEKLPDEIKKSYNTYMPKIVDLLKSIENKASEIFSESSIHISYDTIINPIVTVHGEIKNYDEDIIQFFSPKMNKARLDLFNALPNLETLEQQLGTLIKSKENLSEQEKEELKALAKEKNTLKKQEDVSLEKKRSSQPRTGSQQALPEPEKEIELEFINDDEKKESSDEQKTGQKTEVES